MSRRKQQQTPLQADENYWRNFIEKKFGSELGVELSRSPQSPAELDMQTDMRTFIQRVAQKLIPIADDYEPDVKRRLLAVREQYQRELTDVLNGKEPIEKWFNRTRNNRGLHAIDLTKILYESLEGLRSSEAKQLRIQYGEALQRIITGYHPPI